MPNRKKQPTPEEPAASTAPMPTSIRQMAAVRRAVDAASDGKAHRDWCYTHEGKACNCGGPYAPPPRLEVGPITPLTDDELHHLETLADTNMQAAAANEVTDPIWSTYKRLITEVRTYRVRNQAAELAAKDKG